MTTRRDRPQRWGAWLAALWLMTAASPAVAQDLACRQALALGLDVSGSVDAREYRLQLDGIVTALDAAPVRAALLALPNAPVDLMVYEWSGPEDHHVLADWTTINGAEDIAVFQETLRQTVRRAASPATALGAALRSGAAHLARRAHCAKRSLDISGDGRSNMGDAPETARAELARDGITVNALVIGVDMPRGGDMRQEQIGALSSYFRERVIVGPDAFVQTALGYEAYAKAMERKLVRELETRLVARLATPPKRSAARRLISRGTQ
ncbi:DUF1194 domain-containing protein [Aliishimia ponticola]|uniref:DUF1194 domain-containing protein n=1 Tax=Aliishimia ponticola TaxID=2499833 RepID=A0A4S4NCL5_9RHOB|nr:DUF1194 domain-containing protein [Aliishimia ponticola]THH35781.1 DUF1194 domain-containing protein [Aliishimia ponticola]